MKKTYSTPALVTSGNVIGNTLGTSTPPNDGSQGPPVAPGSMGFNL